MLVLSGCQESTSSTKAPATQSSGRVDQPKPERVANDTVPIEPYDMQVLTELAAEQQRYHEGELAPQAAVEELDIAGLMDQAGHYFMAGRFQEAVEFYDQVIEQAPGLEPRLWQRGLALYYCEEFEKGVAQFETHQTVNSADVENAVWHMLCQAKQENLEVAREKMIQIRGDTRIPMSEVYQMFEGKMKPADVIAAASEQGRPSSRQFQLYYAYLYCGLYLEMTGEADASLACLKAAAALNPIPVDEFMGQVARVHFQLREKQKALVEDGDQPLAK